MNFLYIISFRINTQIFVTLYLWMFVCSSFVNVEIFVIYFFDLMCLFCKQDIINCDNKRMWRPTSKCPKFCLFGVSTIISNIYIIKQLRLRQIENKLFEILIYEIRKIKKEGQTDKASNTADGIIEELRCQLKETGL